jgi:hypothetical protein
MNAHESRLYPRISDMVLKVIIEKYRLPRWFLDTYDGSAPHVLEYKWILDCMTLVRQDPPPPPPLRT